MVGESRAALAIIEAAYRLDGPDEIWLEGLAEGARSLLDVGLGAWAILYSVRNGELDITSGVQLGGDAERLAVFHAAARQVPVDVVVPIATTLSGWVGAERCLALARAAELPSRYGIVDGLRIGITDPAGFGIGIGAPLGELRRLTRREVRLLERVAAHAHTALRARRRRALADDAVLSAEGRVLHAEGEAKSSAAREALREAAVAMDRARGSLRRNDPDVALEAWRAMVRGRWTLVDRFERDGRRFLVARPNTPGVTPRGGLSPMETTCALYAAMGHSGKLIAYELGIAESTVSTHLRSAMQKLGIRSRLALAGVLGHPG